jgi:hypothetical protein
MALAAPRDTTRRKRSEGLRLCGLAWFAQADAMRLKKLHEMGGIYFDWDVSSLTHSCASHRIPTIGPPCGSIGPQRNQPSTVSGLLTVDPPPCSAPGRWVGGCYGG